MATIMRIDEAWRISEAIFQEGLALHIVSLHTHRLGWVEGQSRGRGRRIREIGLIIWKHHWTHPNGIISKPHMSFKRMAGRVCPAAEILILNCNYILMIFKLVSRVVGQLSIWPDDYGRMSKGINNAITQDPQKGHLIKASGKFEARWNSSLQRPSEKCFSTKYYSKLINRMFKA